MTREFWVSALDAVERGSDAHRDGDARALCGIACRPAAAAQPVGAGELRGERGDLFPKDRGAAEIIAALGFLELRFEIVESSAVFLPSALVEDGVDGALEWRFLV